MTSRRKLEEQADEILLKDGRSFFQGYVKTSRPFTMTAKQSARRILKEGQREYNRAVWAEVSKAYQSLPKETRADIRNRYRKHNPNSSPGLMSWTEWITAELEAHH